MPVDTSAIIREHVPMPDITANTSNSDYVRVTTPKTLLVSGERDDIRGESIIVSSQISFLDLDY